MRPGCIRLVVSGGERLNWRASCDNLIIIIFRILLELQNSKLFLKIKNNNNNTCNSVLHVLLYAKNFLLEHNINKITMESDSRHIKTYMYICCMYIYMLYNRKILKNLKIEKKI